MRSQIFQNLCWGIGGFPNKQSADLGTRRHCLLLLYRVRHNSGYTEKCVIPSSQKTPIHFNKMLPQTRYNTKDQMYRASLAGTCRQGKTRYNNWRLQTIQAFQQFFICHRIVFRFNAGHIIISKSVVHRPSLVFNISLGIDQCCFQI